MKSIRLSLTVYFLGLLALVLGASSGLVYEIASQTLQDKQRTMTQLVNSQYAERCHGEEQRLDKLLESDAAGFVKEVRSQVDRGRYTSSTLNLLNEVGLLASQATPNPAALPLWLSAALPTPPRAPGPPPRSPAPFDLYRRYHESLFRRPPPSLQFNGDELFHDSEPHVAEYYQIHAPWSTYRSHSLASNNQWLPLDPAKFDKEQAEGSVWDDVPLDGDITLRRVVRKAPLSRFVGGPRGGPNPTLYIQCAYNLTTREAKLHEFATLRDEQLAAIQWETEESLHTLRARLLMMSAATFVATVVGAWLLIWLGLRPLRRLSDAVSRVSEKDFRLQFNTRRLPVELQPIVERLTNTLAQLKRAFAREKQATADISHELRTPLAALLTTTELALRKSRTAAEYREMLEDCRLSGQQMNRAVERLLALARLDAGVDTMRPERVDVARLAEQCAALVRPLAEARGLQLRVHGGDGAQLLADPDKLREVITNLLHNAIEYNRPQGTIDISVARENGHLHVEVRDTGIGIKPEAKEHIFERFYRADSSRGGEDGLHAGLGLAIVKGYVDLMGGTIHVDSAEGQGSTFHLELPVERARSADEVHQLN